MKKIPEKVKAKLQLLLKKDPLISKIIKEINSAGGASYLVGGAVRDLFLDIPTKDIDIEIHGINLDKLSDLLGKFGPVDLVGKSFGVLKLHGLDVDWSVPRRDSSGRKPKVEFDPNMSLEEAFKRRDLTINSMGINLITDELVDPFNGLEDLNNKILRATDSKFFIEDPLRFFRVMQFISRFEFFPDKKLEEICKKIDISKVSRERIESEFEKLLLKSKRPSLGIRWLEKIGRLKEVLPELYETVGVEQNPEYHPEGDVFEHSMQALDEATKLVQNYELLAPFDYTQGERIVLPARGELVESIRASKEDALILLYAALCHDLGKPETTKFENGKIRSIGHDRAGVDKTKSMLKRITHNKDLIATVSLLVKYHMSPLLFVKMNAGLAAYKRLANKLSPYTNLRMLTSLSIADKMGRVGNNSPEFIHDDINKFIKKAKKAKVYESTEKPVLQGKDLLDVVEPGPKLGEVVKEAYKIQIDENIKDKNILKERIMKKFFVLLLFFNLNCTKNRVIAALQDPRVQQLLNHGYLHNEAILALSGLHFNLQVSNGKLLRAFQKARIKYNSNGEDV